MSGYQRCLSIRQLNTSSKLLNAAVSASSISTSSPAAYSQRILLTEDVNPSTHQNSNEFDEIFREVQRETNFFYEHLPIVSFESKDLNAIVQMIEFNQISSNHQLETILEIVEINPSSLKKLNDRQLSILIQAGGKWANAVPHPFRLSFVEKVWKAAMDVKADLGILSNNARIEANIENEIEQNPVEILKEFSAVGIEADENTFTLLSKIYALKGQTGESLLNIVDSLKKESIPAAVPLLKSLLINKIDRKTNTKTALMYITSSLATSQSAEDIEEISLLMLALIHQSPRTYFIKDFLYSFLVKCFQFNGPKAALQIIDSIEECFHSSHHKFKPAELSQLFVALFEHKDVTFNSALAICNKLVDIGVMTNRRIFLEVAATYLIEKEPYPDAFHKWSSACSIDRIIVGGDMFFDFVLSDKKSNMKTQQKRITQLAKLYEEVRTPSEGIAQLIVSLITTGRKVDAKILWANLDVDCKHFIHPINRLINKDLVEVNLIHLSEFVELLDDCVIKEMNAKQPRKNKVNEAVVEEQTDESTDNQVITVAPEESKPKEEKPLREENMDFLLKRWQIAPKRKGKYVKRKTRKFHVKPDHLRFLMDAVQKVRDKLVEFKE